VLREIFFIFNLLTGDRAVHNWFTRENMYP
jgi:hypothetical protein